jgi:hypothetical protein
VSQMACTSVSTVAGAPHDPGGETEPQGLTSASTSRRDANIDPKIKRGRRPTGHDKHSEPEEGRPGPAAQGQGTECDRSQRPVVARGSAGARQTHADPAGRSVPATPASAIRPSQTDRRTRHLRVSGHQTAWTSGTETDTRCAAPGPQPGAVDRGRPLEHDIVTCASVSGGAACGVGAER